MLLSNALAYSRRTKGCMDQNGLAKSGRSLVLSVKAFSGRDIW